jgi:hypothetical protein
MTQFDLHFSHVHTRVIGHLHLLLNIKLALEISTYNQAHIYHLIAKTIKSKKPSK